LGLQNIDLRGTTDWELIIDAIDNSLFETAALLDRRFSQPMSAKVAVDSLLT